MSEIYKTIRVPIEKHEYDMIYYVKELLGDNQYPKAFYKKLIMDGCKYHMEKMGKKERGKK